MLGNLVPTVHLSNASKHGEVQWSLRELGAEICHCFLNIKSRGVEKTPSQKATQQRVDCSSHRAASLFKSLLERHKPHGRGFTQKDTKLLAFDRECQHGFMPNRCFTFQLLCMVSFSIGGVMKRRLGIPVTHMPACQGSNTEFELPIMSFTRPEPRIRPS